MFRHDRRELERLAARLEGDRARVAHSRERLGRAVPRVFRSKLALLAPFTAGALVGAAVQYRKPRAGGRFALGELLASAGALTGLAETFRSRWMPWLVEIAGQLGAPPTDADDDAQDVAAASRERRPDPDPDPAPSGAGSTSSSRASPAMRAERSTRSIDS